ncbi:HNH endonuclease signature motif containing protein [Streptococcus halotolerans]|uniref:HNH endonuclease signature motif containing protein n=1 Tax=Streptococcus halotolerans TaxID=1814128 RepID=UPI001C12BF4F|nr:HNH endonuclease signature motif containing protein [Streptococcus halotolerans]
MAKDVAQKMNKKFGLNLTAQQIKTYRGNHKIDSGLTGHFPKGNVPFNKGKKFPNMPPNSGQFKKGHKPSNWYPVGTVNKTTDGYPKIKVAEPDKWELLHRREWVKHNGPIPDGHRVAFLDGNKENWKIDNLTLLNSNELVKMNKHHYFSEDPELTKVGIGVVKVNNKIQELNNVNNN